MTRAIFDGKKVLWCGNGGSAADSQHLAAELMGRFRRERRGLASIALTTDTSVLTAIGNDYGYEKVFQRQVEGLCVKGDVWWESQPQEIAEMSAPLLRPLESLEPLRLHLPVKAEE